MQSGIRQEYWQQGWKRNANASDIVLADSIRIIGIHCEKGQKIHPVENLPRYVLRNISSSGTISVIK
jgi:hypothetical protein